MSGDRLQVIRLPAGKIAPADADCIRIEEQADGKFLLTGTTLCNVKGESEGDSVALVATAPYETYDAAEGAGIAWAALQEVLVLHIARSEGKSPLPDPA